MKHGGPTRHPDPAAQLLHHVQGHDRGQCLFACEGLLQKFHHAWNWPARIRWDNSAQALVNDYGRLPELHRRGDEVIWRTPAEPTSCADVQRSPPIPRLKPEQPPGQTAKSNATGRVGEGGCRLDERGDVGCRCSGRTSGRPERGARA
jgi:hypothetical protein